MFYGRYPGCMGWGCGPRFYGGGCYGGRCGGLVPGLLLGAALFGGRRW